MFAPPPLLSLVLALSSVRSGPAPMAAERVERRVAAMGTLLEIAVDAPDRRTALAASEGAVRAIEAVEARLSTWTEESELALLNACDVGRPFALSSELAADLGAARRAFVLTGGAFDPAVGSILRAFDLRGAGRWPTSGELTAARVPGGFDALECGTDQDGRPYAVRTRAQLVLEEGAFGKGVGLDAALAALASSGATSAVLDFGGQVAVLGRVERFAIAHPRDRQRGVVAVEIEAGSFSTSANSERARDVDGRRIGHILDPRTGAPARDFGSVTVFARDAVTADALSTGCFVLGPDAALELCTRIDGLELLVLETNASGLRARATPGLRDRLRPLLSDLAIEWFQRTPFPDTTGAAGNSSKGPSLR